MKLPLIPLDKANHIVYGFAIYFLLNLFLNPFISLSITCLVALSKEIYDQFKYKGGDWKDLLVTLIAPIALFLKTILIN